MQGISCGFAGAPQARELLAYHGATAWVNVGLDPNWTKELNAPPRPDITNVVALTDTGAQDSCIDRALATRLRLPAVDRQVVCGVGRMEVDVFMAQIHIEKLKYTIYGRFAGVPLEENGHRQLVLLGRSFLRDCKLTYDGRSGEVTTQLAL